MNETVENEKSLKITFPPETSCVFSLGEKEVGALNWGDGIFKFEGNADKSAKIFFDLLRGYIDNYIKQEKRSQNDSNID